MGAKTTLSKLGASALLTGTLAFSAGAHAALDAWGTYSSASTSTCASFSETCSVGTGPSDFVFGGDNVMGSQSTSTISDNRGSSFASATVEALNNDLNSIVPVHSRPEHPVRCQKLFFSTDPCIMRTQAAGFWQQRDRVIAV